MIIDNTDRITIVHRRRDWIENIFECFMMNQIIISNKKKINDKNVVRIFLTRNGKRIAFFVLININYI